MEFNELSLETQANLIKEAALIENQPGTQSLFILARRGNNRAKKYIEKFKNFHILCESTWDKVYKENNVDHIYKLSDKILNESNDFLAIELLKIWNEINNEYYEIREEYMKVLLAVKIICFSDYGFINEMRKRQK